MTLPTSSIIDLLGRTDVHFQAGGRKRATGRVPATLAAEVFFHSTWPEGPGIAVPVRELSVSGAGFWHRKKWVRGAGLVLQFKLSDGQDLAIRSRVVHVNSMGNEEYYVGVDFREILKGPVIPNAA